MSAYSSSLAELLAWCICNAIIALAAIFGNTLILATFIWRRKLRRKRHLFVACLACADALVGVLSIPFWIATLVSLWMENLVWMDSGIYKTFIVLDVFLGLASVFHLLLITVERLYAVAWPVRHRVASRNSYLVSSAVAWLLALITSTLLRLLPEVDLAASTRFLALLICYLVPLLSICATYTAIWTIVKVTSPATRSRSSTKELKLAGTVFMVVVLFVISWMPFVTFNAIVVFCSVCSINKNAVYFTKLLHYTNSALNPLVYASRLPDFKAGMVLLLCRRRRGGWRRATSTYGRATTCEVRSLAYGSRRGCRVTEC